MLARRYAETYEMPVAITRLANVYGGGDLQNSRLVPAAARALAAGSAPVVRSDGTPERDFIYAADAVDAYLAVAASLTEDRYRGRVWNAGADRPVAIADLVRRLARVAGSDLEPEIRGTPRPGARPDRQWLDSWAIRAELGWEPRWSLDDGLAETYRWYAAAAA
jgi:CDP-glucose 4,6-dehydratase